MPTPEQPFAFTEAEIQELQNSPAALALLMDYHDCKQTEGDAMWGNDDCRPQGNELRRQVLHERGRAIMAEDLDLWPNWLRREFGFST